jgi:hypothetical protein
MRREPPFNHDKEEADYESYCDSRDMLISHETMCGWYGDVKADEFQARRLEEATKNPLNWKTHLRWMNFRSEAEYLAYLERGKALDAQMAAYAQQRKGLA